MPLRHRIVLSVAILLGMAFPARGQPRVFGPDPGRDARQGVSVRESAVVEEKFALAQRMERLKEWDKSADVLQEVVEKFADRVVAVGEGGENNTLPRFASVTLKVQEILGNWPEDGLKRYRARYENPAASMLESAGADDAAALSKVMRTYFVTDAAKLAGMRLIELYIESGEFSSATWVGERMLAHHPGITDADRPKLLFRTALAEHLAADDTPARKNLQELKNKYAAATGIVRGQEVVLADELGKMLGSPPPVARWGMSPDVWPIFGGDPSRSRIPQSSAKPSARLPVDIAARSTRPLPARDRGNVDPNTERAGRDNGAFLNIMPVVDRGELFYQDGQHIYAKGLESGLTLPGWAAYPADDVTRRNPAATNSLVNFGCQYTVTLTDTSALAVFRLPRNQPNPDMGNIQQLDYQTPLVCYDRATGALRWSMSPEQFPPAMANLRTVDLGGSPLVVGDNVYVAARGIKQQSDDAYVICFALADGKPKWQCYLASGPAPTPGASPPTVVSHLSYAGGRLYAVSNIGVIGAVDAYDGTIVWLSVYPRPAGGNPNGINFMPGQAVSADSRRPWTQNPTIVKDGRIFCLPSDSRWILVYDAGTGTEIKRIATSALGGADTLLGVVDDYLIVNNANKVFGIDWRAFDAGKAMTDNPMWVSASLAAAGATEAEAKDTIRGRGFVTSEFIFIPTKSNLVRLDLQGGKVRDLYPAKGEVWSGSEGPGNVLVTTDQVIVAGNDYINVYSDLALARAKLNLEEQASPNDPLPRLKYAETLFAAGEINPAVEKLDQAIELLGGLKGMRPGSSRDRVFARAMAFAERSGDPKTLNSDPERANALYDRAAAAAYSPQQQITWRLSRAQFTHRRDQPIDVRLATEIRLYQDMLSTPAYRTTLIPADDANGGATPAGSLAEARINDCLRQDRNAYAPFEKAASDALTTAQQTNDPAAMLAVAQTYPNAKCARTAMLAAAQAFEDAGNNRQATQILGHAYRKFRKEEDVRTAIIEAQARNYLLLPNGLDIAIGRLSEGLASSPRFQRHLKLRNGEVIAAPSDSFAMAVDFLRSRRKRQAEAPLPEFNIPETKKRPTSGPDPDKKQPPAFEPETPETVIQDVDKLLVPPRDLRDRSRYDRIVTWTRGKGVSAYTVGGTASLGTASIGENKIPPLGALWVGSDLLVWTADSIVLLKGDALAAGWKLVLGSMDMPEIVEGDSSVVRNAPPNGGQPQNQVVFRGGNQIVNMNGRRVVIRGNGQMVFLPGGGFAGGPGPVPPALRRPDGGAAPAEQIQFLRPVGDRAVFATTMGRIAAVDLAGGQVAWQTRIGESRIDQLVASDDFVAARYLYDYGAQMVALDTFAGQVVMRRTFTTDSMPQNLALSPDGTLIFTLPDRVCGKDLFEPGTDLKFKDEPLLDNNNRIFEGATGPDQLVVSEERILALADSGQFVRVLSAEPGRKVTPEKQLATGAKANTWTSWIRVVGSRMYVFHEQTPKSFNLTRTDGNNPFMTIGRNCIAFDAFVGKRHLVVLTTDRPNDPRPDFKANTKFSIIAYARYPAEATDESGRMDQNYPIAYPTEIDQWQPVEGGFYYRGGDRRAHFLKGTASPAPAAK